MCRECVNKMKFDQLRSAKYRLNAYRGLASEAYISLSSKDPILTAFQLSKELKELSSSEKYFKVIHDNIRETCFEGKKRGFNSFPNKNLVFTCLLYKSFENTVGKGEIARHEQFLLFPSVFSTHLDNFLRFSPSLETSSVNSYSLEESLNLTFGKFDVRCVLYQARLYLIMNP